MINVGVIGLGMMGSVHLDVYARRADVNVIAISDKDPAILSGEATASSNIEGVGKGVFSFDNVKKYEDGHALIADPHVQLVDICLPTPLHLEFTSAALAAGKHVLVEKPLARTTAEAFTLVEAADKATGLAMPAMCMRFWPGWDWLKQAIAQQTYGKVWGAQFRRLTSYPAGPFYADGKACGGALLDLHIHDTDFVQYCFGMPKAVFSRGYSKITSEIEHVLTHYIYDDVPLVTSEGGWVMAEGFGLQMQYTVNFERATVLFDFDGKNHVTLIESGKGAKSIDVGASLGYEREIDYFIGCIAAQRKPTIVTLRDAANSVKIVEAERQSIESGQPEKVSV